MGHVVSKCGNICTLCPWSVFVRKKIVPDEWDAYAQDVKKYTGYTPTKLDWEGCVGCQTHTEELPKHPHYNFLKGCKTRDCALKSGATTCAHCTRYLCGNSVGELTSVTHNREATERKLGESISDEDYEKYLRVFDAIVNLDEVRASLKEDELVDPAKPKVKQVKIKSLPDSLKNTALSQFYTGLSKIYDSDFDTKNIDTIVGYERKTTRRNLILRLLWILGLRGEVNASGKIEISSSILPEYKKVFRTPTSDDSWKSIFSILKPLGIQGGLEILTDKLYTPGGWMREIVPGTRETAYLVHFTFSKKLGKMEFFNRLKQYVQALDKKYGKRSYSYFSKLDFSVLEYTQYTR